MIFGFDEVEDMFFKNFYLQNILNIMQPTINCMSPKIYTKCLICGEDLIQEQELKEYTCGVCGKTYISNYACKNNHHICSACAVKEFFNIAKEVCVKTKSKNPIEIAEQIMSHPNFTIVGCKHYIVAPLALFTAYKNCVGKSDEFEKELETIKEKSSQGQVSMCKVGGLCGIPLSVGRAMYSTYPINTDKNISAGLANKFSADCMRAVINPDYKGSSDCCKRNVYITIIAGAKFIGDNLWVDLDMPSVIKCKYSGVNPRCNKEMCRLFAGKNLIKHI